MSTFVTHALRDRCRSRPGSGCGGPWGGTASTGGGIGRLGCMTETPAESRTPDVDPAYANRATVPGAAPGLAPARRRAVAGRSCWVPRARPRRAGAANPRPPAPPGRRDGSGARPGAPTRRRPPCPRAARGHRRNGGTRHPGAGRWAWNEFDPAHTGGEVRRRWPATAWSARSTAATRSASVTVTAMR